MDRGYSQGLGLPFTLAGGRRGEAYSSALLPSALWPASRPPTPTQRACGNRTGPSACFPAPKPSSARAAVPCSCPGPSCPALAPVTPQGPRAGCYHSRIVWLQGGGEGSLTSLFPSLSPVLAWGPISVERRTSALQHGLRCFKSTRVSLGMAVKHWQQPCV